MGGNVCLLMLVGVLFGWETALYSIIFQFCSTQVVNMRHDRYKLNTLMLVTNHPDEVSQAIFHACHHGITKMVGEGLYTHQQRSVLFLTINVYETQEIVQVAKQADPNVFISVSKTERIIGNYNQEPLD